MRVPSDCLNSAARPLPPSAGLPARAHNSGWKSVWKNNEVSEDTLVDTREFPAIEAADGDQACDLPQRFSGATTTHSHRVPGAATCR